MVSFTATNFIANQEKYNANEAFHPMIDYLCRSPIYFAISHSPPMNKDLLTTFYQGAHLSDSGRIRSKVLKKWVSIDASTFTHALWLPQPATFGKPSHEDLRTMSQMIGYSGDLAQLGDIKWGKVSPVWAFFFDITLRCLSRKIGG